MKVQVFDADYSTDPLEVTLYGKSREGPVRIRDREFRPYLYVLGESFQDVKDAVEGLKVEDASITGTEKAVKLDGREEVEALKVYGEVPADIPKIKDEAWDLAEVEECREFDIPFYRRYLIDKGLRPGETVEVDGEFSESEMFKVEVENPEYSDASGGLEPELLAFDLEVVDGEIVMASFAGDGFRKLLAQKEVDQDYAESMQGEAELVQRFIELINSRDPDVLVGYNTDEFDFPELREACERNGLTLKLGRNGERMKFNRRGRFKGARIKGRVHYDIYPFVENVLAPGLDSEKLDLDSVASELLGQEKDDMTWTEMKKAWNNEEGLEEFADYALKDAELAYRLGDETFPQLQELSNLTGLTPFDCNRLSYGQLTENFLVREAYRRNMLARNRPSQRRRSKRDRENAYKGGFVYTPEQGLYEDIAVFDFRSLYPTVMVAHNISPETLNVEGCGDRLELEEFDFSFCQDEEGFFPELVRGLVSSRYEIKKKLKNKEEGSDRFVELDNRQQAQKVLANSFYGYMGYSGARWYSRECAQATTFLGRKYIQDTIEKAEDMGFEMVYGDTDSVMIRGDDLQEKMDRFLEEVNSELPRFMELEFEGFFTRGLFTSKDSGGGAKKKYALMDEDGNLKITGFAQVRRDWSPIAKETQEKVLEKVLKGDVDGAAEYVKDTVEKLRNRDIGLEKLRILTTLTKRPEEYSSTSPHVEAAKKAEKRGEEIDPDTTIEYIITRSGKTVSDRAELKKFADSYDADYYIENQVVPAAERVLRVFGYTEDQLKGKGEQSGLDRFG